jgi:hypothetical protein
MALNIFTGSTTANWGTSASWTLNAIPTATDGNTASFVSTSPNCNVNILGANCNNIDLTTYNKLITFTNTINVSGNVVLGTLFTTTGVGGININGTGSMQSNGYTFSQPLTLTNPYTFTLLDNWNVNNTLTCTPTTQGAPTISQTINGFNFNCYKNITWNGNQNTLIKGTTIFNMLGSDGTYILNNQSVFAGTIVINMGNGTFSYAGAGAGSNGFAGTFSYLSGKAATWTGVYMNGSSLGTPTFNWNGRTTYLPISMNSMTANLLSDIYLAPGGSLTLNGTYSLYITGASGSPTIVGSNNNNLYITDGGFTGNTTFTNLNVYLQPSSGLTIPAIILNNTSKLTYTTLNPITLGTLTLNLGGTFSLDTKGQTFSTTTINYTSIPITLNSTLTSTNMILANIGTTNGTYSFIGTAGFIANNFTYNQTTGYNTNLSLQPGITYSVLNSLTLQQYSLSNTLTLMSNVSGSQSKFVLSYGASQSIFNMITTDIDSSVGQTITPYLYGTQSTNTKNWINLVPSMVQTNQITIN